MPERPDQKIIFATETFVPELAEIIKDKVFFIVIDKKVNLLLADKLAFLFALATDCLVIESIESHKSEAKLNEIYQMLYENEANAHSYVLAIGGGLILDLAGYASATFKRGLRLITIPTTLLAMVDASVGGKVAINKYGIKNIIGTFYPATATIINQDFLQTLTSRQFGNGLAEVIKYGLISAENILTALETYANIKELRADAAFVNSLIAQAIALKLAIVKKDYYDTNERHLLNYAHSIAHCIELDYDIYHGEAVALGILINLSSTDEIELFYRLKKILQKFNLIRVVDKIDFAKIKQDKKNETAYIKEVFIENKKPVIKEVKPEQLITSYQKAYQVIKRNLKMKPTVFHFYPHDLAGKVSVGPSKSYMHRYLLACFLANDSTVLNNVNSLNDDIITSMKALEKFNVKFNYKNNQLLVDASDITYLDKVSINMRESASSLRIFLPTLMALTNTLTIEGENRLCQRPLGVFTKLFTEQGIYYHQEENALPLTIKGTLKATHYIIDGSVSSQFLSGLLFYLPLLNKTSVISIRNKLVSKTYIDLSLKVLEDFGIRIININYNQFIIKEKQKYKSKLTYDMELDYSSYLYYEALQYFHQDIILPPKKPSLQNDSHVMAQFRKQEYNFDLTNIIDAAPILSILLSTTGGKLSHIKPLRYKESDRLKAITTYLDGFKINYELTAAELIIFPSIPEKNTFNTYHDHRIALALICACNIFNVEVIINEVASINKSIHNFLETYSNIGGHYDEE